MMNDLNLDQSLVLNKFAVFLKQSGKSKSTIDSYSSDVRSFLGFLQETGISLGDAGSEALNQYQAQNVAIDGAKQNSVRRSIIGIRQFFRFLYGEQSGLDSPFDESIIPPRKEEIKQVLTDEQVQLLFARAGNTESPLIRSRMRAILSLFVYEGLKATEVIALKRSDLIFDEKRTSCSLKTSGLRARTTELHKSTCGYLVEYLKTCHDFFDSFKFDKLPSHLFFGFRGRAVSSPLAKLSRHGLKFLLYDLGESQGLRSLNSEILRHYAIHFLLCEGFSIEEIMGRFGLKRPGIIAGHARQVQLRNQNANI